jgi:hypothetical protein
VFRLKTVCQYVRCATQERDCGEVSFGTVRGIVQTLVEYCQDSTEHQEEKVGDEQGVDDKLQGGCRGKWSRGS